MTRAEIKRAHEQFIDTSRRPDSWRTTGGSTAEPLRVPVWHSEIELATKNIWSARSWFGVQPSDRLFLIWGHSHMLGSGLKGWLNARARNVKDGLLGYYRYPAYNLGTRALTGAADALLGFKPDYLLGYSVALDRFARVNRERADQFHRLGLKLAIATAESFPSPDSRELIEEVLGCQVRMEYGAVETGPLAHQGPAGPYRIFWSDYILEGIESKTASGCYEILVTSLYRRCLPLVRYRIGDLISDNPDSEEFNQEFERVVGRCNDFVLLKDQSPLHSEAFSHAVKDNKSILGYQVIQSNTGLITLNYTSNQQLEERDIARLRDRLGRISPELTGIAIERADRLEQTVAGKTLAIVRAIGTD